MNEKITLPSLVALLSARTADTKKDTEDFVKEFFASVSDLLASGETVKVKDIGVFKTLAVEARKSVNVATGEEYLIPGHNKVVFIPSKEIAAEVNAPFEMFETVELAYDAFEEEMPQTAGNPEVADTEDDVTETVYESESESVPDNIRAVSETMTEIESEEVIAVDSESETESDTEPGTPEEVSEEDHEPLYEIPAEEELKEEKKAPEAKVEEPKADLVSLPEPQTLMPRAAARPKRFRFVTGFACGFLFAVIIIAIYAVLNLDNWKAASNTTADNNPKSEQTATAQSAAHPQTTATESERTEETDDAVPTQPSDDVVYDTITKTRYLTTMAKDHYGNFNLWPYIYLENKSLGHPDRIRPGTQVVIPPLSKYGVDPKNPKDIAAAKAKGAEIYSRYK